jgi:hypothetical protein
LGGRGFERKFEGRGENFFYLGVGRELPLPISNWKGGLIKGQTPNLQKEGEFFCGRGGYKKLFHLSLPV